MGISTHILSTWEKEEPKNQDSLRGKKRRYTDAEISFIVSTYKGYAKPRERVKIKAFMTHLRQCWKKQQYLTPCPSRKTVEDILTGNNYRTVKAKQSKKGKYCAPVKRYFPHVQSVMDGKEVIVNLNGEDFNFVLEYSKDMATDAICGSSVSHTETSELVSKAFENHCKNYNQPLGVLLDNGSGNKKAAIDLGNEGILVIYAHPYRAQTKGQIEGEFGLFERKVSRIAINGKNPVELAMSVLETISKVYINTRNSNARCSVCPFTPNKLMKYELDKGDANKAFTALKSEREKKLEIQQQRLKISEEHTGLVESIVAEHKLEGDLLTLKKSLRHVEIFTLKQAEQALYVQIKKAPGKKTMAYFCAIARNMQAKKDETRRQEAARRRYGLDEQSKKDREAIENELKLRKQQQQMINEPHLSIIDFVKAELTLPGAFRKKVKLFKNKMDDVLMVILKKKKQQQDSIMEKMKNEIMQLNEYSLENRLEIANYLTDRIVTLANL